jgi:hypothetical protein
MFESKVADSRARLPFAGLPENRRICNQTNRVMEVTFPMKNALAEMCVDAQPSFF